MTTACATLSRSEQIAYKETYEDVQKLLCNIVWNFVNCYGIEFDELMGEAHFAFSRALARHRKHPEVKFSTMVYFMASMRLKTYVKKLNKHRNLLEIKEELCGSIDHNSFLVSLRSELTPDANAIVSLLVDSSQDMQLLLAWRGKPRSAHGVKKVLREHLMDIGWHKQRIETAFGELRQIFT